MKVITVVGARPQFIKASMLSKCFRLDPDMQELIIHTGQHYDKMMSDVFFGDLEIPEPDYNLGIGSLAHGMQTGRMLEKTEDILLKERPDLLLVYGDTNSTLAGALAAAKMHIPVAHVEAGLRSFNRAMPEELNRILTDHLSDYLFVPTEVAVNNLIREGIANHNIYFVGDVMYDAALYYVEKAERERRNIINKFGLKPKEYILATVHRAENTDLVERLTAIFEGLSMVAEQVKVVLPLHPRTKAKLKESNLRGILNGKITVIDPVGYLDMLVLEKNSRLIVTDSGGVQKEAYFFRVPCATIRGETEWVELVEAGWNKCFISNCKHENKDFISNMIGKKGTDNLNLYGDGKASNAICNIIKNI